MVSFVEVQSLTARLLQAGLDHIDQGITVFDGDLKMVGWNRRFLELLNFPDALAFYGADFDSFIRLNAQRGEYGECDIEQAVAERVSQARQFKAHRLVRKRPDGKIIQVQGEPLPEGGFVTVYTDITEQCRREEELERHIDERTEALIENRARLKLIANEVPAGIAHIDREMRFRYVNERFARAYGYEPEGLVGRYCADVLAEETMNFSRSYFEQTRRGASVDFEMTLTLPDKRSIDIRTFLRPEQPSKGEVIGFYLLSVDVSRQKAATAALLQAQKMDAVGRLSSGIAHDFNNLLTIILGNLEPLREKVADNTIRETMIAPSIRAARRGAELTRRLLTVARGQPLEPTSVDVDHAISNLVKLLHPSLPGNIKLKTSSEGQCRPAFVDPAQLEMSLLNLAMNAREAISTKGTISIHTSMHRVHPDEADTHRLKCGDYIKIIIEDDGAGLPPENCARIFEPFFSTKSAFSGSGLGLSMVYGFIRQSNGMIKVESDLGKGTRFILYLPAIEDGIPQDSWSQLDELPVDEWRGLALVVDVNEGVRNVMRHHLVQLGYPLVEASETDEASQIFNQMDDISLLLIDENAPGEMSPREMAAKILEKRSDVRVLLMTNKDESDSVCDKRMSFLKKPFDWASMISALNEVGLALRPIKSHTK